jgi:hypothetical protein
LHEVRVALRQPIDFVERGAFEGDARGLGGIAEGFGRVFRRKRANVRKTEKSFRVRLRFSRQAGQDRQTGAQQHHRTLKLLDPVHGHDQGREFLLAEVLKLVDEDRHGTLAILSRFADGNEERRQVNLQIAAISTPLFGFDIQTERDVIYCELERANETSQDREAPFHLVADAREPIQLEKQAAKVRRDERPQRLVLMGFDGNGAVVILPLARRSISFKRTVLPTPRRPVSSRLFSDLFCLTLPKRMRA